MSELAEEISRAMTIALDLNSGPAAVAFYMRDGRILYEVGATKYHALSDTQCGSPTSRRDMRFYINVTPEEMAQMFGERYKMALDVVTKGPARVCLLGEYKQ